MFLFTRIVAEIQDMCIEFTTSISDYNFSEIPDKVISVLRESLDNMMFFEKVQKAKVLVYQESLPEQTYWHLI